MSAAPACGSSRGQSCSLCLRDITDGSMTCRQQSVPAVTGDAAARVPVRDETRTPPRTAPEACHGMNRPAGSACLDRTGRLLRGQCGEDIGDGRPGDAGDDGGRRTGSRALGAVVYETGWRWRTSAPSVLGGETAPSQQTNAFGNRIVRRLFLRRSRPEAGTVVTTIAPVRPCVSPARARRLAALTGRFHAMIGATIGRFDVDFDGLRVDGTLSPAPPRRSFKLLALSDRRGCIEQVIDSLWPRLDARPAAPGCTSGTSCAGTGGRTHRALDQVVTLFPHDYVTIDSSSSRAWLRGSLARRPPTRAALASYGG